MSRTTENQMRMVSVKNVGDSTIPPYAILIVEPGTATGDTETRLIRVKQYTTAAVNAVETPVFAYNSRLAIAAGGFGHAYMGAGAPVFVRWTHGLTGFDANADVGPVDGDYSAGAAGEGLTPIDQPDVDNSRLLVVPTAVSSTSSGGGSQRIWFTIDEVICPNPYTHPNQVSLLIVTPTEYTGGCDINDVPGIGYGGQVEVEAKCNLFSYFVAEDLVGAEGSATYFYPLDGTDGAYCEGRWIADSICAAPECA